MFHQKRLLQHHSQHQMLLLLLDLYDNHLDNEVVNAWVDMIAVEIVEAIRILGEVVTIMAVVDLLHVDMTMAVDLVEIKVLCLQPGRDTNANGM
jgi:hypothetical protein